MSYDVGCDELARKFLSDRTFPTDEDKEAAVKALAQSIQSAIEDWFYDVDDR